MSKQKDARMLSSSLLTIKGIHDGYDVLLSFECTQERGYKVSLQSGK